MNTLHNEKLSVLYKNNIVKGDIMRVLVTFILAAGFALGLAANARAGCGKCEGDKHEHTHGLEKFKEGVCCSADHFAEKQKAAIAEKAKKEYKKGVCCSADHYAEKKVSEAVEASEE